jgi:hypothetical protein
MVGGFTPGSSGSAGGSMGPNSGSTGKWLGLGAVGSCSGGKGSGSTGWVAMAISGVVRRGRLRDRLNAVPRRRLGCADLPGARGETIVQQGRRRLGVVQARVDFVGDHGNSFDAHRGGRAGSAASANAPHRRRRAPTMCFRSSRA